MTGVVTRRPLQATGLAAGTPVVAGGGDQAANGVGVGAVDPGVVALSLGTSGVVFAATDRPLVEPEGRVHAFCHAVPGSLAPHVGHALGRRQPALVPRRPRAGRGLRRARRGGRRASPAGSDGLVFLPYLTGERSPHPDPLARGAFVGLTVTHDRRHLARAVLEGVAYGLRDGLDQMVATGDPRPSQIRASGGGIASAVWRQILADVLGARDRDRQHDRGRGVRRRAAGRRRRRLVRQRRRGRRLGRPGQAGGRAGPGRTGLRRGSRDLSRAVSRPRGRSSTRESRSTLRLRPAAPRAPRASPRPGFLPRMIIASTSSVVTSSFFIVSPPGDRGTSR